MIGIMITLLGAFMLSSAFYIGIGASIGVFLTACQLTTIGFSVGFGTVTWILSTEMFPTKVRAQA